MAARGPRRPTIPTIAGIFFFSTGCVNFSRTTAKRTSAQQFRPYRGRKYFLPIGKYFSIGANKNKGCLLKWTVDSYRGGGFLLWCTGGREIYLLFRERKGKQGRQQQCVYRVPYSRRQQYTSKYCGKQKTHHHHPRGCAPTITGVLL